MSNYSQTKLDSSLGLDKEIIELLELQNVSIPDPYDELSINQKIALDIFIKGDNLLMIGQAGVGKSKNIKVFEDYTKTHFKNKQFYITASTGISAYNIGGITIHSFLGIGTGKGDMISLYNKVRRKKDIVNRIIATDIIVLDEASMISAELFEKISFILKKLRKINEPFGGIQMILSMDPMQLLPVFKSIGGEILDERLIVESSFFNEIFSIENGNIITLVQNFRQKKNPEYVSTLTRIRLGEHTKEDMTMIETRLIDVLTEEDLELSKDSIHIVTTNKKAQVINNRNYDKLEGNEYVYNSTMETDGTNQATCDILKKELESQFHTRGLTQLKLKVGARVMLVKNLEAGMGLVNGSIGIITDFIEVDGYSYPNIKFDNGIIKVIMVKEWSLELDDNRVHASQIPLILAYALTSHKVQGLTLNNAICDIADSFCEAQVYVVLSRVQNLGGLYLKTFNKSKIKVNKKMLEFLKSVNS
jgi:ATP-dependent DNA helicase PIF1